jgi:hypothetical protein
MTTSQMQEFARMGAEARLKTLQEEQQAILRVFPELRDGAAPARRPSSPALRGRRRRMSAAERKAVGKRMRAYWAKRRAEKSQTAEKATRKTKRKGEMSVEARKRRGERMKAYWAARRAARPDGADEGTQSKTARQNGAPSSKRAGKTRRKQGGSK